MSSTTLGIRAQRRDTSALSEKGKAPSSGKDEARADGLKLTGLSNREI